MPYGVATNPTRQLSIIVRIHDCSLAYRDGERGLPQAFVQRRPLFLKPRQTGDPTGKPLKTDYTNKEPNGDFGTMMVLMEPSKTRRMIRRVTIGIILVFTGLFTKYLSEVFYLRPQESWSLFLIVVVFSWALIRARHLLRRKNSN